MRTIYLILGFVSLILGLIGIVLPLLPTTPFLLLTAFFFSKGSKRFYNWFINNKVYKNNLEEFVKTKSMPLKKKIVILALATTLLVIGYLFSPWYARIIIVLVIICKYYYFLFKVKTTKTN